MSKCHKPFCPWRTTCTIRIHEFSISNVGFPVASTSEIVKEIWGCEEMCPFCDEPCRYSTTDHPVKHSCVCHRPRGISGCIDSKSSKLVVETCNEALLTNETFTFKTGTKMKRKKLIDYKKYYVDWDITPGYGENVSVYWRWFMATFKNELSRSYRGSKSPAIPLEWDSISIAQAIDSLTYEKLCDLNLTHDDEVIYDSIDPGYA